MAIELFSLKALADKEKVNYSYLRRVAPGLPEPKVWRGYRLIQLGGKGNSQWLAVKADSEVQYFE